MATTRKSVSRGLGRIDDDPERTNQTQAKIKAPEPDAAAEDEGTRRKVRARNSLQQRAVDPEAANATQARAQLPGHGDPERNHKTQARARSPEPLNDPNDESYHTGQNYQAVEDYEEEGLSADISLEGDGLDALDPEVGSRTKALPSLDLEDSTEQGAELEEDDQNATRAGPPLKLEIVGGPDAGKKRKFKGVRMVIGRTPGVDFQLSDQSVSRRHVELIYVDEAVILKDLGSGNGTKVNGTKVAEKQLEHGDEISIGKTKIRFVDEMAAFRKAREDQEKKDAEAKEAAEKPAEEPATEAAEEQAGPKTEAAMPAAEGDEAPKRDRSRPVRTARAAGGNEGSFAAKFKALPRPVRLGLVGGVGVVLLLLIVGIALRPPPPPPMDPGKLEAEAKMQEARLAAREGDYARVVELVAAAESKVPGIDKSKLGPQAAEELAFVTQLDAAKKAIDERRFEDARTALGKTGKGSLKSEEAKEKVQADLVAAEVAYKKEKVDELLAGGEVEAAKALLAELPVELQAEPGQRIAEFEAQLAEQQALDEKDAVAAARNAAAAKKARRAEEIDEAFSVVERKFAGSEWERAASECTRVMDNFRGDKEIYGRAKKLQGLIPAFGRAYDEGMKKYRQGAKAQAAKPLRSAYGTYLSMGLRANKFGPELQEKIGETAVMAGREALIRSDLVTAYHMFKDASKFDPEDPKARAGLDEVTAKAEDMYQMAYMIRDRDQREATKKFRIVIEVTEPGTATHEKAKNFLASMAPF